jgi:hypothetical protein
LDIYRGKRRIGREGKGIVVLTREPGDRSIELLVKGVPGLKAVVTMPAGRALEYRSNFMAFYC